MRRTAPALSTAAVVCGLLLIAPLPASAAPLPTQDGAALRAAVDTANSTSGTDTIDLVAGTTYTLTGGGASEDANGTGDLDVTGPLVVNGNGATISAAGLDDRIFDVLAGGSLVLNDVVLVGGSAPDTENGGAVRVATGTSLTVSGGAMTTNAAVNESAAPPVTAPLTANSGGAIATAGTTTVTGTAFTGNTASRAGGAIEVTASGSAVVSGGAFTSNNGGATPGNGGGLHITGAGSASVTGSQFRTNTAAEGGALWNSAGGTLTVTNATIVDNTANGAAADQGGGGVFTEGGAVTITGGVIESNQATGTLGSGGGIQNINATVTVTGTEITENTAVRAGGGVEAGPLLSGVGALPTSTTLDTVVLSRNTVSGPPGNGGGLHITGAGAVLVDESVVTNNTAVEGGGLWNSAAGVLNVTGTRISNNTATGAAADQGGGGVFTEGGDVVIDGSTIAGNRATGAAGSGGGILNVGGDVAVAATVVNGNSAVRAGGGIEAGPLLVNGAADPAAPGTVTALVGVQLTGNTATGVGAPGNGGGFHQTGLGDTSVDSSLVADNTAVEGGGLWNSVAGSLVVTNSALTTNTSTGVDGGGALYQDGTATTGGDLSAVNVTITDNTAAGAGGGFLNAGNVPAGLLHATVTGNSTGVAGPVEIGNTVLTANDGTSAGTGVTSLGGNVLGTAVPFAADRRAGANDTTGVTDPRLGALGDNGGATPTRLPATGSPVVDAGVPVDTTGATADFVALIGADQRGVTRPLDGNGDGRAVVDAGAVEAPAVAVTPAPGGGVTPPARPVPAQPNYTG